MRTGLRLGSSSLVLGFLLALAAFACTSTPDDLGLVFGGEDDDAGAADAAQVSPTPAAPDAAPGPGEACEAQLPASRACYTGPAETRGKGRCKDGELTCTSKGQTICVGEVLPAPAEACNGIDDTCDGNVDEGFDLASSPKTCGACDKACAADEWCSSAVCTKRTETSCANGVDDDGDGKTDCADPECNDQACGTGCTCTAGIRVETLCADGVDNDGDGATDCADPSCAGKSCGVGCACTQSSGKIETACGDGIDNDGANGTDCADPACAGQSCGNGCVCSSSAKKETNCADGLDNDGDGAIDCADALDCVNQSCGNGCVCAGVAKKETNCADGLDNDGDNKIDCADTQDCPTSTVCKKANGAIGTCQMNGTCG